MLKSLVIIDLKRAAPERDVISGLYFDIKLFPLLARIEISFKCFGKIN